VSGERKRDVESESRTEEEVVIAAPDDEEEE
jgi:hypothetical protein